MKSVFLFLILTIIVAISVAQTADNKPATGNPPAATAVDPTTYIIGPEDVLSINVWKEPEVTTTVPVRPDGKISLNLINDVQAAGLTPQQLANDISTRLEKFVDQPRVTVSVTQINSRRFFVLGEVTRPGAFPLLPDMTVLQAISTAGGLTQFASGKKAYVLRTENGKQNKYPFNYREVLKGNNTEQNLTLKPGDTIVIP